ncbi:MAG: NUDIX hydrolase [Chloroflexota bacterium]
MTHSGPRKAPGRSGRAAADRVRDGRSTDIASGLGVPGWIGATLRYCSRCGAPLRAGLLAGEDRDRDHCPACGHIAYVNPRLVVTTLPAGEDGTVILIRRGIEPGLGLWAQPGGFLEVDETVTEAAIRETLEETGLVIDPGEIVGLYTRLEAAVVVLVLEARVTGGTPGPTPEALEIRTFTAETIPWAGLAFKTTHFALVDWLARHHPHLAAPEFAGGR